MCKIGSLTTLLTALAVAMASTSSYAEYIRATDEEEIILVSTASEVKLGASLSKKTEKRFGLDDDAALQKRLDDIGQSIVNVCDRKDITYAFRVLKGEKLTNEQKMNAFALPGGYVYIFRDMVELLENDDELASILAHEVGHISAKHSITRMQGSFGAMVFQMLAAAAADNGATRRKTNQALGLLMTSYSREDETVADTLSVRYLKKAGYDPAAALRVIEKMSDLHNKMPIRKYNSYRTHPYLAERIAAINKELHGRISFVDFMNSPSTLGEQ
jgi:predicted Zn-dependent protease